MCLLYIVFDLPAAVNNIKLLSCAMEMQKCVPLVLLSTYKIFCNSVNNINVLTSASKVPSIVA
jgi:hypothetical protein